MSLLGRLQENILPRSTALHCMNNAGVAFDKNLVDTSEDEWDRMINTNLDLITKDGLCNVLPVSTINKI